MTLDLTSLNSVPLVGRSGDLKELEEGLARALGGHGSTWTVQGPGGMGKTRLLKTLEETARARGVRVRWGYCLKESLAPFFPFQQIFQNSGDGGPTVGPAPEDAPVVLYEEEKARRVLERAVSLGVERPLMVLSRDRPAQLRQRLPNLPTSTQLLWLTRNESPEAISPGAIDALAERLESFLQGHPRALVVLTGLEYLVSQNAFLPVLRLVQALRDTAEASGGQVFLSLNVATMESREVSLLEAESEVVREEVARAPAPSATEPPALRLLRYLETLQRESRVQPQLLLLDDLQWADPQSRLAFQFLARNGHDLPLMMVGALRDEEGGSSPVRGETSLAEMLDHLNQEGGLRRITLKGLAAGEAQSLAEGLLHVPLDLTQGDRHFLDMLERTGGNPYFLLESLHELVDEGFIQRKGDRAVLALPAIPAGGERGGAVPVPATLKRLVTRRLDALTPDERAFLDAASVVGSEFDLLPLTGILGRPREELAALSRSLDERHRLVQVPPTEGRISFAHPLVWEVVRDSLSGPQAVGLARQLAQWWSAERPPDVDTLARLSYEAGDREGGLKWIAVALDKALDAGAGEVAVRYLHWRRELLTKSREDIELRARLEMPFIERLNVAGAGLAAQQLAEELMALPLETPLRWEVQVAAQMIGAEKDMDLARRRSEATLKEVLASAGTSSELRGRCYVNLLVQAVHAGEWEAGATAGALGLALPREGMSDDTLLQLELGRAWSLTERRQIPEALTLLASAEARLPRTQSRGALTRFYNTQGALRSQVGDLRGALTSFRAAAEAAHAVGNVPFEILYRVNEGSVCWMLGEYEQGLVLLESAGALAERFDFPRGKSIVEHLRGTLFKELGRYDEAEVWIQRALAGFRKRHDTYHVTETLLGLAYLKVRRGEAEAALPEILALGADSEKMGGRSHADYLMEVGRTRTAIGDLAGAERDIAEARRLAQEHNQRLTLAWIDIAQADLEKARGNEAEERRWRRKGEDGLRALGVVAYLGKKVPPAEAAPAS